jgi:hypothetical protein
MAGGGPLTPAWRTAPKGIYSRMLHHPWHLAVTFLVVITLGALASSGGVSLSSLDLSGKLAAETVILTGAGFLLAILAATVAILAYRLSARVPELGLVKQLAGHHYDPASEPVVLLIDEHDSASEAAIIGKFGKSVEPSTSAPEPDSQQG